MGAPGAKSPPQPDLAAALEHGDDHDVGHADGADQQGDRAQPQEQRVERGLGGGLGAALLIGAAAGLLPALRAARLSPTEALWSV